MTSIISLLLLLFACQKTSQWNCQHISEKSSHCSRLLYQSQDHVLGIDLEFLQTENGLVAYLQVHNPLTAEAKIQIDSATYIAPLHQGQQRVQLPSELQDHLIAQLKEGKAVTITLNGHREIIQAERFDKQLRSLQTSRNSSLLNLKLL